MPLAIMTPIRVKFCKEIREAFAHKFNTPCTVSDTRILRAAMFYHVASIMGDIDLVLDDLMEQQEDK